MATFLGGRPTDRWELEVLRQMKAQLPADWIVVSNVSWALQGDAGYVRDGQSDFVVLVPGSGMVIVEVKGSRGFFVGNDGCWYRVGRDGEAERVEEPPPVQAARNMHELAKTVERRGSWPGFPGRFAYLVAYPNGEATRLPDMFDESTLVTRSNMGSLASRIRRALEKRGPASVGERMDLETARKVARILTSQPFAITRVDTSIEAVEDARKIDTLTAQQFAALRGLFEFNRVGVLGPAGSGKTLLAIWRLRALLEAGKRALFTCYNKDLAIHLRATYPDCADYVHHVDKLFRDICVGNGFALRASDDPAFFSTILPRHVMDVGTVIGESEKFDAIIVDEAQDFGEDRLIALLELLRAAPDSQWMLFADSAQDLYRAGSSGLSTADVTFKLHCNCRNTRETATATNRFVDLDIESMPGVPLGVKPVVEHVGVSSAMADRAMQLAKLYMGEGPVVVLSPFKYENSCMRGVHQSHGLVLSQSVGDLGKKDTVSFSTIKSFKGIEAAVVIVVDIIDADRQPGAGRPDLYVACTRPTSRLAILTASAVFATRLSKLVA